MSDGRKEIAVNSLLSVLLLFALSVAASAQEQGHLNVQTVVQKEVTTVWSA